MIAEEIREDLTKAVDVLKNGGIILYPTDTIWGIGCDATNDAAVKRLFELKSRPEAKAMISLVDSKNTLLEYLSFFPVEADQELSYTQRPLTVIFDQPRGISSMLTAEDGSAAFRIPQNEYTGELCRLLGHPLVSTSANISGKKSPRFYSEIEKDLIESVNYICRYGRDDNSVKEPSRIIKITDKGVVTVIRD